MNTAPKGYAVIAVANVLRPDGTIFSEESLKTFAEEQTTGFLYQDKCLYVKLPFSGEVSVQEVSQ